MATLTQIGVRAGGFMVSEAVPHRAREKITVLSGQVLKAGHVLGKVATGASATSAATAGNTGNGTMGSVTLSGGSIAGAYQVRFIEPGTNLGTFVVDDPRGITIGSGVVGSAFSKNGIAFTLADGSTDFVSGDSFTITVVAGTEKWKEYNPSNTDGSQTAVGVLWDAVDATSADKIGAAVVRSCEVNQEELTWFSGASAGQKTAGLAQLAAVGIIGRPAV